MEQTKISSIKHKISVILVFSILTLAIIIDVVATASRASGQTGPLPTVITTPPPAAAIVELQQHNHVCASEHELTCSPTEREESAYLSIVKEATKMAIMEELVIGQHPETGRAIYARSCTERVYGCEAHIDSIVDLFYDQQERRGIDPLILAAMAKHETNFNPFAVNESTGAAGLLQLMPNSHFAEGIDFIHSPRVRAKCMSYHNACQEEVVEASVTLLERSIRRCNNNLRQGLGMYGSGSCRGSKRFANYVIRLASQLRERRDFYIQELSENYHRNYCDAQVYFE